MELNVKVGKDIFLNPITGAIKDVVRSSMPMESQISIRQIRPALKYKTKIGSLWLGANNISFLLLLSCLMLKYKKSKGIGFYKINDRYFFFEISVGSDKHISLKSGFMGENETPDVFLDVEGKDYDAIFGNTALSNVPFDFKKAYSEVSGGNRNIYIISTGIVIFAAFLFYNSVLPLLVPPKKKPQAIPPPQHVKELPKPVMLTVNEIDALSITAKEVFLDKYAETVEKLKSGNDKWLKNVEMHTTIDQQNVTVHSIFKFTSWYPYPNSAKDGNEFSWQSTFDKTLSMQDIKTDMVVLNPYICLKYLTHYDIAKRDTDRWFISVREKNYNRISFLMNILQTCPCSINNVVLDSSGLSVNVVIDTANGVPIVEDVDHVDSSKPSRKGNVLLRKHTLHSNNSLTAIKGRIS